MDGRDTTVKRFDQLSIKQRMTQRLQVMEEWANVLGVGTIGSLLDTIAEGESEIARYLEYLYQEKKWRNARNMSSLTHMADLIAYKRQLPKSAIGYVVVSHTDVNGIERLPNFGQTFFDLDQGSDYDDLIFNSNLSYVEKSALVPWTADVNYVIPKGTVFKSAKGISYVSLEPVESRALKEPYSAIKLNEVKKADFIRAGGWNGIKYLKVPVIQGELVEVGFGFAKGTRFESFTINALNVENASNIISEKFFKVRVIPISNGQMMDEEIWEKIENIRLAGPYDKVFEIKILNNEDKVLVKFGDGITGQRLPEGAKLFVNYLETKGLAGNIDQRFQITQMVLPPGWQQIDPRTNEQKPFLNVTNVVPIMGGKNIEDEDDVRLNAPPAYLQSYAIATKASYYEQIIKNSPVNLLHCKVFQSGVYDLESYGQPDDKNLSTSSLENGVIQEIHAAKNALLISAIKSNGTKIEDPYTELIDPLIKVFEESSSPNDSFDYIEPNFVEIRPNVIINTVETLTENQIADEIKPEIINKYSIFNTAFDKPYFKSDIVDIAQNHSFTKHSEVFLEAKTPANLKPIILSTTTNNADVLGKDDTLLAFEFKFDRIFGQNKLKPGFKNFRVKTPYLLRCDIIFKERPVDSRSLFLFDNRIDLQNEVELMKAEILPIDDKLQIPAYSIKNPPNFKEFNMVNPYSDWFYNEQVRTAQFGMIPRITSESYVYQMKKFDIEPYEIRPCLVDEYGKLKLYAIEEVADGKKVDLNFNRTNTIEGNTCYQANDLFLPDTKLEFAENYNDPTSIDFAKGYLIIPHNRIFDEDDITKLKMFAEGGNGTYELISENMEKLLKDRIYINVYALPLMETFDCEYPMDIIFSNRDNILVQKNYLLS